jgi:Ca-activated chloride channel family protein
MNMVIAVLVGGVAALAEWFHARRVERVAKLAFGPEGKPAAWTVAAPVVRCVGIALAAWGALVLAGLDPVEVETTPNPRASRQLLICLDVSPSMQIKDAGPDAEKISRARWAGKLTQAILDRLDM